MGNDIVPYPGGGGTGSPAVPGSAQKLHEEGEHALYAVTVLRGHAAAGELVDDDFVAGSYTDFVAPYTEALRSSAMRVTLRQFTPGGETAAESARRLAAVDAEVTAMHASILRWCRAHYGEALVAWMHIKVVRAFVESVLRYGLPVDFITAFLHPASGKEKLLSTHLDGLMAKSKVLAGAKFDAVDGDADEADEYSPYSVQKFSPCI